VSCPCQCKNWMISEIATIRVRHGLELQVGIIKRKKWKIGSPRSMLGVAFFEQEIRSTISDFVSKPFPKYN
jgi:hypothetical protein